MKNISEQFDSPSVLMQKLEPDRKELESRISSFIQIIITLSAGIVGFSVPILDKTDIVKSMFLFKISLFLFVITITLGVRILYKYFLNKSAFLNETLNLQTEIKEYSIKLDNSDLDDIDKLNKISIFVNKSIESYFKKLNRIYKSKLVSFVQNSIFWIFNLGIIFLFFSLIFNPFNSISGSGYHQNSQLRIFQSVIY